MPDDNARVVGAVLNEDGSLKSLKVEQEDHSVRVVDLIKHDEIFYAWTGDHAPVSLNGSPPGLQTMLQTVSQAGVPDWCEFVPGVSFTLEPGTYSFSAFGQASGSGPWEFIITNPRDDDRGYSIASVTDSLDATVSRAEGVRQLDHKAAINVVKAADFAGRNCTYFEIYVQKLP